MNNHCIVFSTYACNGNLALLLYEDEDLLCYITVNLGYQLPKKLGFLNVNHLHKYIIDLLESFGIIEYTGYYEQSGFVKYPLCIFNFDKIDEFNRGGKN